MGRVLASGELEHWLNEHSSDPFEQSAWDDHSMNVLLSEARNGSAAARSRLMADLKRYLDFIANRQFDPTLQAKMGPSDIVQESMMRAVDNLDQFRGQTVEEFRGWVRQILINEARQMKRDLHSKKKRGSRTTAGRQPVKGHSSGAD